MPIERPPARVRGTRIVRPARATRAERDALTGLLTADGLVTAAASIEPGSLILFDLDHFRMINTALDRPAGDRVLIAVARRLEAIAPGNALLARTGADEFAVLLAAGGEVDGRQFAARLSRAIAQPVDAGDEELVLSIGIGVADPLPGESVATMLRRSGAQLRPRIATTGFQEHVYDDEPSPAAIRSRFTLERELRDGLAAGQLRLHYQPIVDVRTGVADEFEALLRWEHPERGILSPSEFLFDLRSETLQCEVGRWVLAEASRQALKWNALRTDRPLTVAVNLSSSHLRDDRLVEDVYLMLAETGLDPSTLKIEISESITLDELEAGLPLINGLRRLGIGLALDDFGAGNAGWTLLRRSHIDAIKLDQSFIAGDEGESPENIKMVAALAGFAGQLGMGISIEGVEREDQAATVRDAGVFRAQGFHFGMPKPAAMMADLIADAPLPPA